MSNVNDTPWDAWQDVATPMNWQKAVQYLASHVAVGQQTASRAFRSLEAHLSATGGDWKAVDRLHSDLAVTWDDAVELGALIGYALARTFPDSFDEMDNWPRRAIELAGLTPAPCDEADEPANAEEGQWS